MQKNTSEQQKKTKEKSRKRKPRKTGETIASEKDNKTPGSPRTKFPPIVLLKHKKQRFYESLYERKKC